MCFFVFISHTGGGTLDVSILRIKGTDIIEVKGTAGDPHLGGVDFTKRIMDFVVKDIQRKKKDWKPDEQSLHSLQGACELGKLTLAAKDQVKISVQSLSDKDGESFKHVKNITRDQFNQLNADLFEKAINKVDEAVNSVQGMDIDRIDEVILVGGSTRIVQIQNMLKEKLPAAQIHKNIDADLAGKCICLVLVVQFIFN